jgi:tRNA/tmRNA/rRNA uracil-C5-methylase (TrmA/RlmC/RlmD family)
MHLGYGSQIEAKAGMIAEALRRTGGFTDFPPVTVMPSPIQLESRLRASWRPSPDIGAGYFRRGSNEVLAIDYCPIINPALEIVRRRIQPARTVQALTNGSDVSIAEEGELAGPIEMTVGPYRLLASADVFFQASGAILEPFLNAVVEAADVQESDRVQDLYAGIGLFSIPLAERAATVDGIEAHEPAVLLGIQNVQRNGVTNCAMQAMTVETWLKHCPPADVTVIDPPRSGLSKGAATMLPGKVQRRLVYVSCDPVTFARDAKRLETGGLRLMSVQGFDMFPHTHHVELVGIFDRKNKRREPRPAPAAAEIAELD